VDITATAEALPVSAGDTHNSQIFGQCPFGKPVIGSLEGHKSSRGETLDHDHYSERASATTELVLLECTALWDAPDPCADRIIISSCFYFCATHCYKVYSTVRFYFSDYIP
jgi:hypothetical protein